MNYESLEHGTRQRYFKGCRCGECRHANTTYQSIRGVFGPYTVSADRARDHMLKLHGIVGITTFSQITGIHRVDINAIRSGKRKRISRERERLILNVDEQASTLVPAAPVRRMVLRLCRNGFTQKEISRRFGLKYQFKIKRKKYVRATTAMRVEKLFNRIMAEEAA